MKPKFGWRGARRAAAVALGLVALAGPATAQVGIDCRLGAAPGCMAWSEQAMRGGPGSGWGRAVATSPDGSLVFVTANGTDLAYEATTGELRWSAPNDTAGSTGAQDIATTPSGSAVVSVGERSFADPERVMGGEIVVTASDPSTGLRLWQARHREPDGSAASARRLAVTDALVVVAGLRLETGESLVLAFDSHTGERRWTATYDGRQPGGQPAVTRPVDIVATPDGSRVFVAVRSRHGEGYPEWAALGFDGATGRRLWENGKVGDGNSAVQANEMALHPDGSLVYVTGWERRVGAPIASFDFVTVAYDTVTGAVRWEDGFSGPGAADDLAWSVAVSPDGDAVYVAGYSGGPTTSYWVEARGAHRGEPRWASSLPLSTPNRDHNGLFGFAQVRPSPDGRQVYVATAARDGTSGHPGDGLVSYGVDALDAASGGALWHGAYAGGGGVEASQPAAMAVDPHGRRLYVTGQVWDSGGGVAQTVAFLAGTTTIG